MPIESRAVGESGLLVSVLGLGSESLEDSVGDCLERVETAFLNGITFFEAGPHPEEGCSEISLGRAVRKLNCRNQVTLLTGTSFKASSESLKRVPLNPQGLLHEIDESRRRLASDVLDLYCVSGFEDTADFLKSLEALHTLVVKGVVRGAGLDVCDVGQVRRCLQAAPVHFLRGDFDFFERQAEKELLPFCREKKIGFFTRAVLSAGSAGGMKRGKTALDQQPGVSSSVEENQEKKMMEKVCGHLKNLAESKRGTLSQWEIARILSRPGVSAVLSPARTPAEISENAAFSSLPWTEEDFLQGDLVLKELRDAASGLSRRIWKG